MIDRHPSAAVEIGAPIEMVWQVMLDTDHYPEWNPFVVRAEMEGEAAVGKAIVLHARWRNGKTSVSPEAITILDPPTEQPDGAWSAHLAYIYRGLPSRLGLVRGTRHQRLRQISEGKTRYETVENFSGPLVFLAGPKRVRDGFERHADALRERCEEITRRQ